MNGRVTRLVFCVCLIPARTAPVEAKRSFESRSDATITRISFLLNADGGDEAPKQQR